MSSAAHNRARSAIHTTSIPLDECTFYFFVMNGDTGRLHHLNKLRSKKKIKDS